VRFAVDVSDLELADYQRTVRLVLRHPLITASWPDERALPRVRRFAAQLRPDLSEAFGYRLELHGSTARLVRTADRLDAHRPATSRTGRPFDRQRYAYLSLCLAALGRARYHHAVPWRMGTVDYAADAAGGLPLVGTPADSPWDPTLARVMRNSGRAVMEERLLPSLLSDVWPV
jgi:hypothetical protein